MHTPAAGGSRPTGEDAQALMDTCYWARTAGLIDHLMCSVGLQAEPTVRNALVRTRVRHVALIGALLRQHGVRVRNGYPGTFGQRAAQASLSDEVRATAGPLLEMLAP